MSKRSDMLEARRKVQMVLTSEGKRQTSVQLAANPLLDGLTPKAIGAHLRVLVREKVVRRNKDKTWSPTKGVVGTDEPTPVERPRMFFVLNTTGKTLSLDVGGVRLPVEVEM